MTTSITATRAAAPRARHFALAFCAAALSGCLTIQLDFQLPGMLDLLLDAMQIIAGRKSAVLPVIHIYGLVDQQDLIVDSAELAVVRPVDPSAAGVRPPTGTFTAAHVPSERTRIKRLHHRAVFDRKTVYEILDAGLMCHVGYAIDGPPCRGRGESRRPHG